MLTLNVLSAATSASERTEWSISYTFDTLFQDVLLMVSNRNKSGAVRLILQATDITESIAIMMWVAPAGDPGPLFTYSSREDAAETATCFVAAILRSRPSSQESIVVGFESSHLGRFSDDGSPESSTYIIVLSIVSSDLLQSHYISLRTRQELETRGLIPKFPATEKDVPAPGRFLTTILSRERKGCLFTTNKFPYLTPEAPSPAHKACLLVILVYSSLLLTVALSAGGLFAFLRLGSFKLIKQHALAQDNFFQAENWTTWSSNQDLTKWHLRSDIGALVPSTEYDIEELPRLKWIENEVPELARLFGDGHYPPPEDYGTEILTGEGYHFAHCALTLRRFYWAHKRGWGLCPKDLDDEHTVHCLDVVDAHAFTINGTAVIPTPKSTIHWYSPMACF